MGRPGPYAWDPHLAVWVVLLAGVGLVVGGHRRLVRTGRPPIPWTRRQMVTFGGACAASVVALTWPVADLAAHWSLIALVVQRLILLMAVAPMLLLGLPYDVIQWATRPAPVDAVLAQVQRPLVAIATVTVLVIGSMTPVLVRAQASSPVARGVLDLIIVVAGLVLWIPVLGRIPGSGPTEAGDPLRLPGGPGGGPRLPLVHLHLLEAAALSGVRPGPMPPSGCDRSTISRSPGSSPS